LTNKSRAIEYGGSAFDFGTRPSVPGFAVSTASSLGSCMSPIAMLSTGMSVAQIDLKATLKIKGAEA